MAERKKTLLKEGTIRRFMKLAELGGLSENFLGHYELEETEGTEEQEELEEVTPAEADYDEAYEEEGEEEGLEAAEDFGDEELELDLAPDVGEVTLSDDEVETLVAAFDAAEDIVDKLRGAEVEPAEDIEAMDVDLDDDTGEMDIDVDEDVPIGEATKKDEKITTGKTKGEKAYKGPSKGEKKKGGGKAYMEEADLDTGEHDDLVQEISRRVAKRLLVAE